MGIKSNTTVAGGISASFSQSASALNNIKAATSFASRTNVAGNAIHSVAKDFSAIDQQAAQQFQLPSFGGQLK